SATTASATVPSAPSDLTALATSPTQVTLSWTDNSNNETGFRVSRKTLSEGVWRVIGTLAAGTTTARNSGLTPDTTYVYRIVSYNSSGESIASNEATVKTPITLPAPPSALEAAAVSSTRINLSWNDNSTNESGFKIYRRTGSGGSWASVGTVDANVTNFQNSSLDPSVTYNYRVTAWNVTGESANSNEASATTPATSSEAAPAAPTGLQATASSTSQVSLAWIDTSTNETGFLIQRRSGINDPWLTVATTPANTTTYVNGDLVSNSVYVFRVRALNGSTESTASNEASILVPVNSFTNLTSSQSSSDSVSRSSSKYYKLYVPEGATQLIVQTTGTGDVDLYLRSDTQPTRFTYGCRSIASNSTERCAISAPKSGDWHILVYGYGQGTSNFTITAGFQGGTSVRIRSLTGDPATPVEPPLLPLDPAGAIPLAGGVEAPYDSRPQKSGPVNK
ncbi:MAG: fibronectin type III domain-containing protein, partial [Acidobacteriota bacterium]